MWVGGGGVTRGYINLPELTAKRYKLDKFRDDGYAISTLTKTLKKITDLGSSKMFNTGDLVRWREDGSLETFGRSDDQVKIKVR